ncbi:MAG: MliC family protein [Candidatus Pacebacteria bacterium]|nr:MliC family protein [Candidatus Paceibacterota bacterium]
MNSNQTNPTNPTKNPAPTNNNKAPDNKLASTEKMDTNDKRFWTVIVAIIVVAAIVVFGVHRFANAPSTSENATDTDATGSAFSTSTDLSSVQPVVSSESDASSTAVYTYSCDGDKSITATFHLPQDDFVNINLSDGRHFILAHVVSADGARYANANEQIVFWNKGDTAFLTENGTTTYSGCVANRFP